MAMNNVMKTLAGVAATLAVASAATATSAATWTIELRGTVPLVCHADLPQSVAPVTTGAIVSLGQLNELCNDGNGFHVYANTPAGTGGAFVVDGRTVPVSASGQTEIDSSMSAVVTSKQLAYDPQGGATPQSLTISVVAN
jgi:hypothetical protein